MIQANSMHKQGVNAIILIANNVKNNCTIYKNLENGLYLMILALSKMVLELQLWFLSSTMRAILNTSY